VLGGAGETLRLERCNSHPVLRWNASNVSVRHDPAGNIKPDKERSSERIDGISALVNGLGRALLRGAAERFVYETRDILFV
jgi:phage terminase large subunit-like protein